MATLRAARQAYKDAGRTTDAWFIRIEREDGTIVRITNSASDVVMNDRVLKDATVEALAEAVIYHSVSGYNPTAVATQDALRAGTFDLEGVLDAISGAASATSTDKLTPPEIHAVNSVHGVSSPIEIIIDGNNQPGGGSSGAWTSIDGTTNEDPEWVSFDFKQPCVFNRVKVYSNQNYRLSILRSDDGQRYDEVTAPQLYLTSGLSDNAHTIDLPYDLRSRYAMLKIGSRAIAVYEVEFYHDKTGISTGSVNRTDLENNLYDNAKVFIFMADYTDPYEDDEKISSGYLTDIELRDGTYMAQYKDKIGALDHRAGRKRTASCDAALGSFRCGVHLRPPTWTTEMYAYETLDKEADSGTWIKPTVDNGHIYFCAVPGIAGVSEPTWSTVGGAITIDGGISWVTTRAKVITTTITSIFDDRIMGFAGISTDGTHWQGGTCEFKTGPLAGKKVSVTTQVVDLLRFAQVLSNQPDIGDEVELTAGCLKRFNEDCRIKWSNGTNFQGSLFIPGSKIIKKFGGQ